MDTQDSKTGSRNIKLNRNINVDNDQPGAMPDEQKTSAGIEVELCMGTACHVHGAADLLHRLKELEQTYPLELRAVPCLNSCRRRGAEQPPVIRINGRLHFALLPEGLEELISSVQEHDDENGAEQ